MADFTAIASVGKSLERFLSACFTDPLVPVPVPGFTTKAVLARTEDFDNGGGGQITPPCLSIFLYRIDFNKTMRAAWSAVGSHDGLGHLPLDLHYMLTPWASDPELEHRIVGRAMQSLETTPILSGPLLTPAGGWAPNEGVQVLLEDVPTEWVMRTFDSLPTDFKLSIPYVARVTRIDSRQRFTVPDATTVVTGMVPSATS
jgi:Pvc16 N-terminal domain